MHWRWIVKSLKILLFIINKISRIQTFEVKTEVSLNLPGLKKRYNSEKCSLNFRWSRNNGYSKTLHGRSPGTDPILGSRWHLLPVSKVKSTVIWMDRLGLKRQIWFQNTTQTLAVENVAFLHGKEGVVIRSATSHRVEWVRWPRSLKCKISRSMPARRDCYDRWTDWGKREVSRPGVNGSVDITPMRCALLYRRLFWAWCVCTLNGDRR